MSDTTLPGKTTYTIDDVVEVIDGGEWHSGIITDIQHNRNGEQRYTVALTGSTQVLAYVPPADLRTGASPAQQLEPEPALPPHLSAVRYQAEELAFYVMTLLQHGVPAEMAERLALHWLERHP